MTNIHQQTSRVLVLGGGYAGLLAAARVSRSRRPAAVTLIDAKPAFTQRIRLHEALAGSPKRQLAYAPLLARRGVRFVEGRIEGIDLAAQTVSGRAAAGGRIELPFDELIVALGSFTAAPVPGVAEHAVRLDDIAAVTRAAGRLRALPAGSRVLVAGSGLTGIETAAELAGRYPALRVTMASRGRIGDGYSPAGAAHLRGVLERAGVEIREGTGVTALEAGRAWLADGGALPFDLAVWCGGFAAPPLLAAAGLAVDGLGRAVVDETLAVPGRPNVFVAGDAGAAPGPGGTTRMSCAAAMPLGAHAGENVRRRLEGRAAEPFAFAFALRCISLGRRDGLVQLVHADDAPKDRVLTGLPAAALKEAICRMTVTTPRLELSTGLPLYRWPQPKGGAGATAPGTPLPESLKG